MRHCGKSGRTEKDEGIFTPVFSKRSWYRCSVINDKHSSRFMIRAHGRTFEHESAGQGVREDFLPGSRVDGVCAHRKLGVGVGDIPGREQRVAVLCVGWHIQTQIQGREGNSQQVSPELCELLLRSGT